MKIYRFTVAMALLLLNALPSLAQTEGHQIETNADHAVAAIQDTETTAQRDARMDWWRKARFGMFIHWGLYSIPAGTWNDKRVPSIGEWIMNNASIPVADYKELARSFNPQGFNAHDIVALAKAAGMKYIIITAKHHDGFAMFDSKADTFNIVAATPFHRDPIRELAEECKEQGVKLGFYYSQDQDWTAPGGAAYLTGNHDSPSHHWDPAQDGDFATYLRSKAIPQLEELLSNYGDFPAVIWFDTPTADMTPGLAGEIVALLNQHPKLIWNNRLGGGYKGDTDTPEQYIPAKGYPGRDWEACMTMNGTWGFKSYDHDFKSTKTLLRNLIDIASKGGNYLLNIGPDAKGNVPPEEIERLNHVGNWLAVNGEAIYGTSATLFGPEAGSFSATKKDKEGKPKFVPTWNWRSTTAANRIYIELFTWPGATFHLAHVPRNITGAFLLADASKKPLKITTKASGVDIELPGQATDPIATVLVLETNAAPATAMVSDPCLPPTPVPDVEERAKSDWPNLCKYRGANAALTTPTRVVFIGDSITESWVTADPKLFTDGVIGRGISGQTSPQILLRFFQDVIELRPQVVHIMAGTNDIAGNTGPTTEQDFKNNIIAMVDLARAYHIQVALASILPASSFSWKPGLKPAATIKELNSWLRRYAQKSHIRYVDYYAVLTDPEGGFKAELSDDGVHPNRDGYAAMRNLAQQGIAK